MSRIGKLPIKVPSSVGITYNGLEINVKGKFGELNLNIPKEIEISQTEKGLTLTRTINTRSIGALHGLYRTLIWNMIRGVSEQFKVILNLVGVGYRANLQDKLLILNLGYSHRIELEIPSGISVEVIKTTNITLTGCDKESLGLFAAKIRSWRPPEPYKGKGIMYENEIVKRKAGKSGKK
jgi:large subunit ribosomal protein L6